MKCVVTANFNINGQPLENPKINNRLEGWDYFLFSNINEIIEKDVYNGWNVVKKDLINNNPLYTAKYYKWLIHKELPEYDTAIYVDSYIEPNINKPWDILDKNFINLKPHKRRNCVYKEFRYIVKFARDTKENMQKVKDFLESERFPENFGLWENNVFLRPLKDPKVNKICEELYDLMKIYSYRDQTLLSYVLWKNNYLPKDTMLNDSWRTKTSRSQARKKRYVRGGKRIYN
tara:strand:+ start:4557 stop:5252 length:696 start_codon:yes stop_codon:yes gene_type:complete